MTDDGPATGFGDDGGGDTSGLASVVFVEPGDDVASVCGRIDTAPTFAVVLHAPDGNRQLATELGMRRLQRHAEESGRVVAIATTSAALTTRAREVGIPVARRPERVRWDSAGRRVFRLGKHTSLVPAWGGLVQFAAVVLVVLVSAGLALTMAPAATITVAPPAETVTDTIVVTASADRSTVDFEKLLVPAQKVSATQKVTLAMRPTGRISVGVKPAAAAVTMTNPTQADVQVLEHALLVAKNDSRFEVLAAVTVPAGKSVTAQVTAASPGAGGNVPAGSITAWADARFRALTATNPLAATGGTSEERLAVDANDIVAIKALAKDLEKSETVRKLLTTSRPQDAVFLRDAETTVTLGEPSAAAGAVADVLFLDVDVTISALAIVSETLQQVAVGALRARHGAGELIPGSVSAVETGARQDAQDGAIRTELRISGQFARDLSPSDIEDAVKGRSVGDAEATLKARYGIDDTEVDLSPGWAPWLPRFGFRIDVRFRVQAEPAAAATPFTTHDNQSPTAAAPATASPSPRN